VWTSAPLYSRKLHIRVRRERTSWVTSLMILAFSLGERVVNHFASLYLRRFEISQSSMVGNRGGDSAYHFALSRQQNEIAVTVLVYPEGNGRVICPYLMAILRPGVTGASRRKWMGWRKVQDGESASAAKPWSFSCLLLPTDVRLSNPPATSASYRF